MLNTEKSNLHKRLTVIQHQQEYLKKSKSLLKRHKKKLDAKLKEEAKYREFNNRKKENPHKSDFEIMFDVIYGGYNGKE